MTTTRVDQGNTETVLSLVQGRDTLIEINPETDPEIDIEADREIDPDREILETLLIEVVARAVGRRDLAREDEIGPSRGRKGLQHRDLAAGSMNHVATTATDRDTSPENAETRLYGFKQVVATIP